MYNDVMEAYRASIQSTEEQLFRLPALRREESELTEILESAGFLGRVLKGAELRMLQGEIRCREQVLAYNKQSRHLLRQAAMIEASAARKRYEVVQMLQSLDGGVSSVRSTYGPITFKNEA